MDDATHFALEVLADGRRAYISDGSQAGRTSMTLASLDYDLADDLHEAGLIEEAGMGAPWMGEDRKVQTYRISAAGLEALKG